MESVMSGQCAQPSAAALFPAEGIKFWVCFQWPTCQANTVMATNLGIQLFIDPRAGQYE
jgi:hypothetical protein